MTTTTYKGGRKRWLTRHKIVMASGARIYISIPGPDCKCQSQCILDFNLVMLPTKDQADFLWPFSLSASIFEQQCLERKAVVKEMKATIREHNLQERGGGRFSTYDIITIHKVHNPCLWKKFQIKQFQLIDETKQNNQRLLFHGTTAADTIVKTGFDPNLAKPSGMFGNGIYFAEHSSKSNQYTYGPLGGDGCLAHKDKSCYECPRQMLLCRVSLGKMYTLETALKMTSPPPGYHSVRAVPGSGLKYPEYVVYSGDQVYPEYLIKYKIVK